MRSSVGVRGPAACRACSPFALENRSTGRWMCLAELRAKRQPPFGAFTCKMNSRNYGKTYRGPRSVSCGPAPSGMTSEIPARATRTMIVGFLLSLGLGPVLVVIVCAAARSRVRALRDTDLPTLCAAIAAYPPLLFFVMCAFPVMFDRRFGVPVSAGGGDGGMLASAVMAATIPICCGLAILPVIFGAVLGYLVSPKSGRRNTRR